MDNKITPILIYYQISTLFYNKEGPESPVSSPIAQTRRSTHAEFAITLTLNLLTVAKLLSRSSLSEASWCRLWSSVCPLRKRHFTNSCKEKLGRVRLESRGGFRHKIYMAIFNSNGEWK